VNLFNCITVLKLLQSKEQEELAELKMDMFLECAQSLFLEMEFLNFPNQKCKDAL
jgi:hypothetical protein